MISNTALQSNSKSKKRKILKLALIIFIVLFVLYWVAIYFLVSTALVPSFLEKLDSFSRITKEEYDKQAHSEEITENYNTLWDNTYAWFKTVDKEKLVSESEDCYKFIAAKFMASEPSHYWVLLLHGYTGWKEEMYQFACVYNQRFGFNAIVPDLRCQGESEGDFIGMGLTDRDDMKIWLDYIRSVDPEAKIVVHGQSMGAATALLITGESGQKVSEPSLAGLTDNIIFAVSDCSYKSAYDMFGKQAKDWYSLPSFPIIPSMRLMLKLRGGYDLKDATPLDAVKKSTIPTLFIHGDLDRFVPTADAYELYESASCKKEILIVGGAGHGQSQDKDPEAYFDKIEEFIKNYG